MIEVRPATSQSDFLQVSDLVVEMSHWDASMSHAAGYPSEAVYEAYYRDGAAALRARLTAPGTLMLIAREGDRFLGCLGFDCFDVETAEVQKFYVSPSARGRGVGSALVTSLIPGMLKAGYRAACLETATFMTDAIAIYRRAGFEICAPFRPPPPALNGLSVFLHRALP